MMDDQRFEECDLEAISIAIDLVESKRTQRNIRNRRRAKLARAKTRLYRLWYIAADELDERRDYPEWRSR